MKRYIVELSKGEEIANKAYFTENIEIAEAMAIEEFPGWTLNSVAESILDVPIS